MCLLYSATTLQTLCSHFCGRMQEVVLKIVSKSPTSVPVGETDRKKKNKDNRKYEEESNKIQNQSSLVSVSFSKRMYTYVHVFQCMWTLLVTPVLFKSIFLNDLLFFNLREKKNPGSHSLLTFSRSFTFCLQLPLLPASLVVVAVWSFVSPLSSYQV